MWHGNIKSVKTDSMSENLIMMAIKVCNTDCQLYDCAKTTIRPHGRNLLGGLKSEMMSADKMAAVSRSGCWNFVIFT